MRHKREAQLLPSVQAYLKRKGFRWQEAESHFFECRIDLYCFSRMANVTVAVELKLTRWRRAIRQALLYQLCSDLVYVALPLEASQNVDSSALKKHGLGLLAVDQRGRCTTIVKPKQSGVVRQAYRAQYIRALWGDKK